MFQDVAGSGTYIPTSHRYGTRIISLGAHAVLVAWFILVPLFWGASNLPAPPVMLAFVAAPPAPPPPPPPPPPPVARSTPAARPVPTTGTAAPVEAPAAIAPESGLDAPETEGVPGGVEGGVPGGVVGGIVGGLPTEAPPPPPPPLRAQPPKAVRVGGDIGAPTLLSRVEPSYPPLAMAARIEGIVILEAEVDTEGQVIAAKILRSPSRVLDAAAVEALEQWRYSPLTLNGRPTPFILTVTMVFKLTDAPQRSSEP